MGPSSGHGRHLINTSFAVLLTMIHLIFLVQGALNNVYNVIIDGKTFAMRVSLAVDPSIKTPTEMTTLG